MTVFRIKRIYEEAGEEDGFRVLVDRLWPRGISKDRAQLDEWRKELAPSTALRKWFGHDPNRFGEFVDCYQRELKSNEAFREAIMDWKRHDRITLLYGAKDEEHNEAVVLKQMLSGSERA